MSAFDTNAPTSDVNEETIESYVAKLVEERGEQWKDPETIAKGKLEADKFIEDLKRQNEELRSSVKREEELQELIEAIKAQNKAPSNDDGEPTPPNDDGKQTATPPDKDDTKALVERLIAERESESLRQKNISEVDAELSRRFGDSASSVVKRNAEQLGMTVQEAQDLAATKPKAFFRLMGLDQETNQSKSKAFVGNAINPSAASAANRETKNAAYFKKMKEEKGKSWYYSPRTQREMADARMALGSAFWET